MGIRERRKNEADKLAALARQAEDDLAAAAEKTKDVPKPEPATEPIPEQVKIERQQNAVNYFPDHFPAALYENRRHNLGQIEKLEHKIAVLVDEMKDKRLDYGTYKRKERKVEDLDQQLDAFISTLHPIGADGLPLVIPCRVRACPEYTTRATAESERGGRCALCLEAALTGTLRNFDLHRAVPPPAH
jgi:hypothetical protein